MSLPISQTAFFDKLVLKRDPLHLERIIDEQGNEVDYSKVNLRGAIAITSETKLQGWREGMRKLLWLIQKTHALVFRKDGDAHLVHGMILLGPDKKKKNSLLIAHSDYRGIRTFSKNYFEGNATTELVIYIPKDDRLREMMARHAEQTAYTESRFRKTTEFYPKIKPRFAFLDLACTIFKRSFSKKRLHKRLSYIVADLLLGNVMQNRRGKARSLFCMPYAMSVLQGSTLLASLSEEQAEKLLIKGQGDRNKIAKLVYWKLKDPTRSNSLSNTFWKHGFCRLNARFVMSQYAAKAMDRFSQKA